MLEIVELTRRRDLPNIGQGGQLLLGVPAREVQPVLRAAEVLHGELAVVRDGRAARAAPRERRVAGLHPVGGPACRRHVQL